MRAILSLSLFVAFGIRCAAQTPALPQYEGSLHVPVFSYGYVIDWDAPKDKQVTVYRPDTQPAYSVPALGADGTYYFVWAVDSDGVAARAYEITEKRTGGIDLLDPSGKPALRINTGSYLPNHVAFAPDHTIWTVGVVGGFEDDPDFNVIRHYSRTGEELGEMLPWSQIAGSNNAYSALQLIIGGRRLFLSNDRIGFVARLDRGHSTWIEAGFTGIVLGKYDLGTYPDLGYSPRAMTTSGGVYAEIWKDDRFNGWAVLDRETKAWRKVTGYPKGRIIGSDIDNLVFSRQDGGWTVLESVSSGSLRYKNPSPQLAQVTPQK